LTDAVPLDLAIRLQGRLATFDRRILGLLPPDSVLRDAGLVRVYCPFGEPASAMIL
jgi:hypothetical protein